MRRLLRGSLRRPSCGRAATNITSTAATIATSTAATIASAPAAPCAAPSRPGRSVRHRADMVLPAAAALGPRVGKHIVAAIASTNDFGFVPCVRLRERKRDRVQALSLEAAAGQVQPTAPPLAPSALCAQRGALAGPPSWLSGSAGIAKPLPLQRFSACMQVRARQRCCWWYRCGGGTAAVVILLRWWYCCGGGTAVMRRACHCWYFFIGGRLPCRCSPYF